MEVIERFDSTLAAGGGGQSVQRQTRATAAGGSWLFALTFHTYAETFSLEDRVF